MSGPWLPQRLGRLVPLIGSALVCGAGIAWAQDGGLPPAESRALVQQKCTACHVASQWTGTRRSADEWAEVVENMVLRGAQVSDAEFDRIVEYLSRNFGPEGTTSAARPGDDASKSPCPPSPQSRAAKERKT